MKLVNASNLVLKQVVLFTFLTSLLLSCSHKIGFQPSSVAPAARGDVKVDRDANGNYAINLDVRMLAEPNRLSTPKSAYLVWMDTEQNGTQALGRLKTDDGLFSKTLKASLKTSSPYKPQRIYITGEDNVSASFPSSFVVLSTSSF